MIKATATPKEIASAFLRNWKLGKHKKAHACCTHTWQSKYNFNQFKQAFHLKPTSYTVKTAKEISDVLTLVTFNGEFNGLKYKCTMRIIKECAPFTTDGENGYWGVYPPSIRMDIANQQ